MSTPDAPDNGVDDTAISEDQVLAEADAETLTRAEREAERLQNEEGDERPWISIVAGLVLSYEAEEEEAVTLDVKRRLAGLSRSVTDEVKDIDAEAAKQRGEMYPEWWEEYRTELAAGRLKSTQTDRILFFLRKGLLVKEVAKMLMVRYQIVYQVATWNELAGPAEGTATCKVCGRPLTQPNSTAKGMGPICAKQGKHK